MKTFTSKSGFILREFISKNDLASTRIALFPEAGCDAEEQAQWVKDNSEKFDAVYTLSPFIISDSRELFLVESPESEPKRHTGLFGASVNKVVMNLWRACTIEVARVIVDEAKETSDAEEALKKLDVLGDSVDKVICVNAILNRPDTPKRKM